MQSIIIGLAGLYETKLVPRKDHCPVIGLAADMIRHSSPEMDSLFSSLSSL